jgi:hypothetical protein
MALDILAAPSVSSAALAIVGQGSPTIAVSITLRTR